MPIYEYGCPECGHSLEVLQSFNDPAPESCPQCRSPSMQKQMSLTSFQLKGSGWYSSDYKKPSVAPCGAKEGSKEAPCAQGGGCPASNNA